MSKTIYTDHAKMRAQQRNIDVDFILKWGDFISQFGGEGAYFMSGKKVSSYIETLKTYIKKIRDKREPGGEKEIHRVKKEIIGIEKMRGKYVVVLPDGTVKTCCYTDRRHQKTLLRERKGKGRHRGRRRRHEKQY